MVDDIRPRGQGSLKKVVMPLADSRKDEEVVVIEPPFVPPDKVEKDEGHVPEDQLPEVPADVTTYRGQKPNVWEEN